MTAPVKADKVLDVKGLLCPLPVIRLSKAIKEMQVGEVIEMQATDPGSEPDMDAWTKNTGHELVGADAAGGVFTFWVRKSK